MGRGKRRPDCKDCRNSRSKYAYVRDRERLKKMRAKWYREHKEEHSARVLAARAKRGDEYREQQRAYRQQPQTKLLLRENAAKRRTLPGSYRDTRRIGSFYKIVLERDGMICHICGLKILARDLEFDHVIPLSRSGAHALRNVRPSHRKCNRHKGASLSSGSSTRQRRGDSP